MNSKRMLLRLLQQVLSFSSLLKCFRSLNKASVVLHSFIEESVKELIVERRLVYVVLFTVKMKTNGTRNEATCSSLGAHHLSLGGSSCSLTWNRFKILSPLFWNKRFGFVDKFCLTRGSRVAGNSFPLNISIFFSKNLGKTPCPGMQNGSRG